MIAETDIPEGYVPIEKYRQLQAAFREIWSILHDEEMTNDKDTTAR